ncbi:hypothetical protein IHE61_25470 [Streptomyces sp. GKU 257-1]|nr:hypothetical protein [Streptomyces sp. GKU 257-1]
MRGGTCDKQYRFTVVAEFAGGRTAGSGRPGPAPVSRVAPGRPQQVTEGGPAGRQGHRSEVAGTRQRGRGHHLHRDRAGADTDTDGSRRQHRCPAAEPDELQDLHPHGRRPGNAAGSGGTAP